MTGHVENCISIRIPKLFVPFFPSYLQSFIIGGVKCLHFLGMRILFPLFFFLSLVMFLDSCKKMPNDGIPFYMQLDSVTLETTGPQGLNTHGITDMWVEANATNLGAYELPCNFPVLDENEVRFLVSAGIWVSGQAGVRDIYPFYDPDTFSITAVRNGRYHRKPVFRYKAATNIAFINAQEAFENSYNNMITCTDSSIAIYGGKCGQITVTATDTDVIATQKNFYALPAGQEIWLELDYKAAVPFWIGVDAHNPTGRASVVFVVPTAKWKKIYVKLSDLVNQARAVEYSLYFEAMKPVGGVAGNVYLDNIKIVHF